MGYLYSRDPERWIEAIGPASVTESLHSPHSHICLPQVFMPKKLLTHVLKGYFMQHIKYILFDCYLITAKMFSEFLSNHIQNLEDI